MTGVGLEPTTCGFKGAARLALLAGFSSMFAASPEILVYPECAKMGNPRPNCTHISAHPENEEVSKEAESVVPDRDGTCVTRGFSENFFTLAQIDQLRERQHLCPTTAALSQNFQDACVPQLP